MGGLFLPIDAIMLLVHMSTKWSAETLGKAGKPDFGALMKNEATIVLLRGKNVFGDFIYCYLKIAFPDLSRLQAAISSDIEFNISDFGTVIAAGKGDPPEDVKQEIASAYPMLDKPESLLPSEESPSIPAEKKNWDEY